MNCKNVKKSISQARFQKYESVCAGCEAKSLKLYQTNLRLSQSFYPLLSLTEIILRNSLNERLATHFKDCNWIINQRSGFMSDPLLTKKSKSGQLISNDFLKKEVTKSHTKLGYAYTHSKLLADLHFGFWVALFDSTHFKLLSGEPLNIFDKRAKLNRSNIKDTLIKIRDFRNRIYHNEPIIFSKDADGNVIFSTKNANDIYKDIQNLFLWLNLDFKEWTRPINNVELELKRADKVMALFPQKSYYIRRIMLGLEHYRQKYLPFSSTIQQLLLLKRT